MEVLAASHDLTRIQVDTNNIALFRFERILLGVSNTNQFGSNGFVKYISPMPDRCISPRSPTARRSISISIRQ